MEITSQKKNPRLFQLSLEGFVKKKDALPFVPIDRQEPAEQVSAGD